MFQNGFYVSIRKTDKREVSDNVHDLPPDNGPFEEYRVADFPGCPSEWSKDGLFVPVEEGQPLWFDFRGNVESACLASVQRINPVTGETANLTDGLTKNPLQNYLKLPDQLWLDGYSKEGKVYQFVVVTEGKGEAVNEVLLPKHMQDSHAMGFAFFLPKPRPEQHRWDYSGASNMTQPMWFSPTHTPQNWKHGVVSSSSARARKSALRSGESIVLGSTDSHSQRFTQNRVADNNCVDPIDNVTNCSLDYDRAAEIDESFIGLCGVYDDDDNGIVMAGSGLDIDTSQMDQASMGAGGRIGQDIICDNNTVEYYQEKPSAMLTIYLALPEMFKAITKKGKRQNAKKKDAYKTSGHIGGVPVPLV